MKRLLAALGFLLAVAALAVLALLARESSQDFTASGAAAAATSAAQIERGQYLVRAGDCIACHTAQGGVAYAGGRRIPTPFGALYSTNLTPDADTGLGHWSADDFWRALHFGRSRDGRRLYPAFPYPDYTRVTRADADAMFAFLRALPPTRADAPAQELRLPYSTQWALRLWRALWFRPGVFENDPEQSDSWNRGAYLVEGLGHCGACHTARNRFGVPIRAQAYAGGPIPMLGWDALPLTAPRSLSNAEAAQIAELLRTGVNAHSAAAGPMAEVIFHSLQYLDAADLTAMVEYLRAQPYREAAAVRPLRVPADERKRLLAAGEKIYAKHCADCHGERGEGQPYRAPALAGSRLLTAPSAADAIQLVRYGGFSPSTAAVPQPYGMPSYSQTLSPDDIAAVLSYARGAWGNNAGPVAPTEVGRD